MQDANQLLGFGSSEMLQLASWAVSRASSITHNQHVMVRQVYQIDRPGSQPVLQHWQELAAVQSSWARHVQRMDDNKKNKEQLLGRCTWSKTKGMQEIDPRVEMRHANEAEGAVTVEGWKSIFPVCAQPLNINLKSLELPTPRIRIISGIKPTANDDSKEYF